MCVFYVIMVIVVMNAQKVISQAACLEQAFCKSSVSDAERVIYTSRLGCSEANPSGGIKLQAKADLSSYAKMHAKACSSRIC